MDRGGGRYIGVSMYRINGFMSEFLQTCDFKFNKSAINKPVMILYNCNRTITYGNVFDNCIN